MRNQAPKIVTIIVALVLTGIGALGTFASVVPQTLAIWSYVAATGLLLLGVFFKGL